MIQALRFPLWVLLLAVLGLTGCQSAPPKGLTAEQIAVLKREGFTPTDEGRAYDLSGKVLFGSDLDNLNSQSQAIVERIGKSASRGWSGGWTRAHPVVARRATRPRRARVTCAPVAGNTTA